MATAWVVPSPLFSELPIPNMKSSKLIGLVLLAVACGSHAETDTKSAASTTALYTVVDGDKVDAKTMEGFRTWRAAACDRCHGANQEGMVGPSLLNSLKVMSKEDFKTTVAEGRLEKGMVSFKTNKVVMDNLDNLYAYLKGRSDGAITKSKVQPMP